jgi:hypothetical protein
LRQKKLDVVVDQRRKEQEMQKQQNMTAVTSGGVSNRGDSDEIET